MYSARGRLKKRGLLRHQSISFFIFFFSQLVATPGAKAFLDVRIVERQGFLRLAGDAKVLAGGVNSQAQKSPHWAGKGHA